VNFDTTFLFFLKKQNHF